VAIGSVIAMPPQYPPKRPRPHAEMGAAAVVLEAGQHALGAGLELDLDRDVADQPRAVSPNGFEIDQADARQRLIAELIGVPEELEATAPREDNAASARGSVQRVALDAGQVKRAQLLIAILPTPDVEEIGRLGIEFIAEVRRCEREAQPTPLAPT